MSDVIRNLVKYCTHGESGEFEQLLSEHKRTLSELNFLTHLAVREGQPAILQILIARGFDINNKNNDDYENTPLHVAARAGRLEMTEILLKQGAMPNLQNKHGNTALHIALEMNRLQISELLLQRNVDIDVKNHEKKSCRSIMEEKKFSNLNGLINKNEASARNARALQILSYNVCGLRKQFDPDFYDYIKKFDIFFLYETHLVEKSPYVEFVFSEYTLHWGNAEKIKDKGRASEGELYGIRKNVESVTKFEKLLEKLAVVKITSKNEFLWIIPIYLSTNAKKFIEDYADLEKTLGKLVDVEKEKNIMLVGDFNVRIGDEQCLNCAISDRTKIHEQRNAMDSEVKILRRSKKIIDLCEEFGLTVLNGRTKGDKLGAYTFVERNCGTTIDYGMIRGAWMREFEDLIVQDMIYSDHQPLEVKFKLDLGQSQDSTNLSHYQFRYEKVAKQWQESLRKTILQKRSRLLKLLEKAKQPNQDKKALTEYCRAKKLYMASIKHFIEDCKLDSFLLLPS